MTRWKILPQISKFSEKIENYLSNALHYYQNSQETLQKKEFGKAGELLWGAIAETVKAIYLQNNEVPIHSHNEIRKFLENLSTLYRRKDLQVWKRSADSLHVNFYETHLDEPTFMEYYQDGEQLFGFLNSILKSKRSKQ